VAGLLSSLSSDMLTIGVIFLLFGIAATQTERSFCRYISQSHCVGGYHYYSDGDVSVFSNIVKSYYAIPYFVDVDGDGDLDILVGDFYGKLYVYLNVGNVTFPQFTDLPVEGTIFDKYNSSYNLQAQPIMEDFNGDGLRDLVVGSAGGIHTFINTGNSSSPFFNFANSSIHWFDYIVNGSSHAFKVSAFDFDNDGDLDILVSIHDDADACTVHYHENIGDSHTPSFVDKTSNVFDEAPLRAPELGGCSATASDVDNDGDLDLVLLSSDQVFLIENTLSALHPQWVLRDGSLTNPFAYYTSNSFPSGGVQAVDLYNVGVDTFVVPTSSSSTTFNLIQAFKISSTVSEAVFTENRDESNPFSVLSVGRSAIISFVDFAGEGNLLPDCVVFQSMYNMDTSYYDSTVHYYRPINASDSIPDYTDLTNSVDENPLYNVHFPMASLSAADFDNDGDMDLVLNSYNGLSIVENQGTSPESDATFDFPLMNSFKFDDSNSVSFASPQLVDLDGDMDLDLVVCAHLRGILFVENIGTLAKPEWREVPNDDISNPFVLLNNLSISEGISFDRCDLAFCDIDNDGDSDLVFAEKGGLVTLMKNSGTVSSPFFEYTPPQSEENPFRHYTSQSASSEMLVGIACGDVDGDGDPDIIISENEDRLLYLESVRINSSLVPQFETHNSSSPGYNLQGIDDDIGIPRLVDFDNDGVLDLVFTYTSGTRHYLSFYVGFPQDSRRRQLSDKDDDNLVSSSGYYYYYYDYGDDDPQPSAQPSASPTILTSFAKIDPLLYSLNIDNSLAVRPAFGDLNGDSVADMMVGLEFTGCVLYYESVNGRFDGYNVADANRITTTSVTTGDINGDGLIDLAFGASNGNVYVSLNAGGALHDAFPEKLAVLVSLGFPVVELIDVDDDGDLDICVLSDPNFRIFENTGNHTAFVYSSLNQIEMASAVEVSDTQSFVFRDIDRDGDVDILLGLSNGGVELYSNNRCFKSSSSQCSSRGACVDSKFHPSCVCFTGYSGDQCNACQDKFYGFECDPCPGGGTKTATNLQNVCNQQGTCHDGISSDGVCTCISPFFGDSCGKGDCGESEQRAFNQSSDTYFCEPCRVGYIKSASLGVCVECPDGRSTAAEGSTTCDVCSIGNYYDRNADECHNCKSGMKCSKDFVPVYLESIYLDRDWYRTDNLSSIVEKCPFQNSCRGGNMSGENICMAGTEGPLCAVCSSGYYYAIASNSCLSCGGISIVGSLISVGIIAIFCFMGGILTFRYYYKRSPRFRMMIKNFHDTAAMVLGMRLGVEQLDTNIKSNGNKRRHSELMRQVQEVSPIRKMQSKVKIVVTLFQIVTSLPWVLSVQFPNVFSWFLSILYLFNFEMSGIIPLDCVMDNNFFYELIVATFVPIGLALGIGLVYGLISITRWNNGDGGAEKSSLFRLFLMLTYLVYPGVSSKIFRGLRPCHTLDDGESYMVEDYSINCSSQTYAYLVSLCYIMTAVYVIGIPLMYMIILLLHRHQIREEGQERVLEIAKVKGVLDEILKESDENGNRSTALSYASETEVLIMELDRLIWCYSWSNGIMAFDFLFAAYRAETWWWEVFETLRRLALTGLLVFLSPGSPGQLLVALVIAVFCGILYIGVVPFMDSMDSMVSSTSQISLIVVLFAALAIKLELMKSETYLTAMGVVLVVVTVLVPVVGCFASFASNYDNFHYTAKALLDRKQQNKVAPDSVHSSDIVNTTHNNKGILDDISDAVEGDMEQGISPEGHSSDNIHIPSDNQMNKILPEGMQNSDIDVPADMRRNKVLPEGVHGSDISIPIDKAILNDTSKSPEEDSQCNIHGTEDVRPTSLSEIG